MLKIWEPEEDALFDTYEALSPHEALPPRDTASHLFWLLGYDDDEAERLRILKKAITVCRDSGVPINDHFRKIFVHGPDGIHTDYLLTDLACYLITINADAGHPAVARAQIYFLRNAEAFRQYSLPDALFCSRHIYQLRAGNQRFFESTFLCCRSQGL